MLRKIFSLTKKLKNKNRNFISEFEDQIPLCRIQGNDVEGIIKAIEELADLPPGPCHSFIEAVKTAWDDKDIDRLYSLRRQISFWDVTGMDPSLDR